MRTILIALVVLCLTGCGSETSNTSDNTSITGDLLTLDNYNQIKLGMTREQVEALIGPGKNESTGGASGAGSSLVITSYRWEWNNEDLTDARTVSISFQNDSVASMSQYGLP